MFNFEFLFNRLSDLKRSLIKQIARRSDLFENHKLNGSSSNLLKFGLKG